MSPGTTVLAAAARVTTPVSANSGGGAPGLASHGRHVRPVILSKLSIEASWTPPTPSTVRCKLTSGVCPACGRGTVWRAGCPPRCLPLLLPRPRLACSERQASPHRCPC
eukprot:7376288-Prymnesium_polylepis.1